MKPSDLHVVSVHSNPVRFEARARLFADNQARQARAGVTSWVVEAVFGEREPEVADPGNPHHLILRCDHEVWLKEAMINAAVQRLLPADARYVMWQDADIRFLRDDWAMETLQALQHWAVVQPRSHAIDLGPSGEVIQLHNGFAFEYHKGNKPGLKYAQFMHPGYCWAWRRAAWDAVGGMLERAICGAADHHMAGALIGMGEVTVHAGVHPNYKKMVADWQAKAEQAIRRDIGFVDGTIAHDFHGWKEDRDYIGRWSILTSTQYDPQADVVADSAGMLRLHPDRTWLRDQLRRYFRQRNEDAGRKAWPG